MRWLRAIAATLGAVLLAAGVARAQVLAPETTEVFVGEEESASLGDRVLAHRFVLRGSERLLRDGRELVTEVDYRLDGDAGAIRLAVPLAPGERLTVRYAWVPLDLPRDFVAVRSVPATPPDSARMDRLEQAGVTAADRWSRAVGQDLVIGGAKTLAIEVGSAKDANVEQSLRVSATGHLSEDVRLTALLSDQNIPLQPEGNTQRLEELDEVLIRVEGPRGTATLGDFVARRTGSTFTNFERRLSGAEAELTASRASGKGIGASNRGTFRSVEFPGVEGKQGPYVLAGDGLNPAGVIVAGSERVWLDGRELERGDARDYVIDYSRGELEFTNRVLVSSDSEIAVDFEVAEQEYKRSFVLGEGRWESPDDGFRWRTSILSEVDGDDPLNLVLDDARRAALEAAGDSFVMVPGAVCGVEEGDYTEVGDHFEWAGADSGTCDVSFSFVGEGAGNYARDRDLDTGLTFFRFVGDSLGAYSDSLRLPAPRTVSLADMTLNAEFGSVRLTADGAFSRDDRNTFSDLDDNDNDGSAGRAELAWTSGSLFEARGPVTLETSTMYRGESREFASIGRTRPAYLGQVWNFVDSTRADESNGEFSARLGAGDAWSVGGSAGFLERVGRFRSARRQGAAAWSSAHVPVARVQLESVTREEDGAAGAIRGDLRRQEAELGGAWWVFRPGVSLWKEDREDVRDGVRIRGRNEEEVAGSLALASLRAVNARVHVARRTADVVESGEWVRESVSRTVQVTSEANPARSLRARLAWSRRTLDFEPDRGQADRSTNLTRADLLHEAWDGLLREEYVYETTARAFSDFAAGPGGNEEPSLALEASARIRLGGRSARRRDDTPVSAWRVWLGRLQSETLLRVEEETTASDRGPIYHLDFSRFQNTEDTVFGRILTRQEVTLFPGARQFSLTGRWERTDTKDNRILAKSTDTLTERRVLRARNQLAPRWTVETQGTWQEEFRGDAASGVDEFEVRLLELQEEVSWQPTPATRLSGRGAWITERNTVNDSSIRGVEVALSGNTSVFGEGRFRGEITYTHPTSMEGVDTSNQFRTRDRDKLEWRGTLDVRMSDSINASVSYSGRRNEGLSTIHLARAEVRALF